MKHLYVIELLVLLKLLLAVTSFTDIFKQFILKNSELTYILNG